MNVNVCSSLLSSVCKKRNVDVRDFYVTTVPPNDWRICDNDVCDLLQFTHHGYSMSKHAMQPAFTNNHRRSFPST